MPEFSVIIPLYNKEQYIARAIDSVLGQTIHDFELIIIDDGSTDRSAAVVKQYADPRIRIIQQDNSGVSAARNRGAQEARHEYIAFLDADDIWDYRFLETISSLITDYQSAGAFITSFSIVGPDNKKHFPRIATFNNTECGILHNFIKTLVYSRDFVFSSSLCLKKSVFKEIGGFPIDVAIGEDYDFLIRLGIQYPIAFSSKTCATVYRNATQRSTVYNLPEKCELAFEPFLIKSLKDHTVDPKDIPYAYELIAKHYYLRSMQYLFSTRKKEAWLCLKKARPKTFKYRLRKLLGWLLFYMPDSVIGYLGKLWGRI